MTKGMLHALQSGHTVDAKRDTHFMGGAIALLALSDRDHLSWVMRGHTERCSCMGTSAPSASDMDCRLGLMLLLPMIAALMFLLLHVLQVWPDLC